MNSVMLQGPMDSVSITGRERHGPSIQVRVQDQRLSGPPRNGAVPKGYISRRAPTVLRFPQNICVSIICFVCNHSHVFVNSP